MPSVCATCGQPLNSDDESTGAGQQCPRCAGAFAETGPAVDAPRLPRRPDAPDPDDDEFDDDPLERRRNLPRGEPHRGNTVMGMGIASLVLFFAALGGAGAFGPIALPISIVGLVFGILGWTWGRVDLRKMNAGTMDVRGRGNTQAGYICGIVGTILHAISVLCGCAALLALVGFLSYTISKVPPAPPPRPIVPARPAAPKPRKIRLAALPSLADYLPRTLDVSRHST